MQHESRCKTNDWLISFSIGLISLALGPCAFAAADEIEEASSRERAQVVGSPIKLTTGQMFVIRQTDSPSSSAELLIHFHGAVETVRKALARSTFRGTLVVVNFPGLSTAYSKPFEQDPELLDTIIRHALTESAGAASDTKDPRIILSSFSAGYGAIRQILKTPRHFDRVGAIVTADSIYAGLDAESPERLVSEENMRDFLRFAELSTKREKTFALSHSAQATPYASTTETASFQLRAVKLTRTPDTSVQRDNFCQSTLAQRGQFTVLGFAGDSGQHHMRHLHNIDVLWNHLLAERIAK